MAFPIGNIGGAVMGGLPSLKTIWFAATGMVVLAILGGAAAAEPVPVPALDNDRVVIVGIAPSGVDSIDPTKAPRGAEIVEVIEKGLPGAFLSDAQSNVFQPDLLFRGFDASPVLGTPQGLAVFQNGARINEPFGDTVLWDLVPTFAIESIDVAAGSDPLLGRNALGGAVAIQTKNGFSAPKTIIDIMGGSYGRASITGETAHTWGDIAGYAGVRLTKDDGWRTLSQSGLAQAFADLSQRDDRGSWGVSATFADTALSENAAISTDEDPKGAFAVPDTAKDRLFMLQGRHERKFGEGLVWRSNAFVRASAVHTLNGEASQFRRCTADPKDLCGPDGEDLQSKGRDVRASVIGDGLLRKIKTITNGGGLSTEIEASGQWFGLRQTAIAGIAYEGARAHFRSVSELGRLSPVRGGVTINGIGIVLDDTEFNTRLNVATLDAGVYVADTITLTPSLSARISGRWNADRIKLSDQYGTDLTGKHDYARFNPAAGLTWTVGDIAVSGSYGESSRNPTAAELSCADPDQPCTFPLSFASDPPLRKVVARSGELKATGSHNVAGGKLNWSASVFEARTSDDIFFISSGVTLGQGYFANVGKTERRGADLSADYTWRNFDLAASYAYLDATFRSPFRVRSAFNPGADANGEIAVAKGDRLPNIPRDTARLSIGWRPIDALYLKLRGSYVGRQVLRGDEANLQPKLGSYELAGLDAEYRVNDTVTAYLEADNLFDRKYATFGAFSDPTGGGALPQFKNPRFISPGTPATLRVGVRFEF